MILKLEKLVDMNLCKRQSVESIDDKIGTLAVAYHDILEDIEELLDRVYETRSWLEDHPLLNGDFTEIFKELTRDEKRLSGIRKRYYDSSNIVDEAVCVWHERRWKESGHIQTF